jgi:molybdopterin molybdotransferase
MKKPAEARALILSAVKTLGSEVVDVLEASGRVVAEEVRATRDLPPWDNSAMDGYALRVADAAQPPAALSVSQSVGAGQTPTPLLAGTAARIMTGAPLPDGADTVVMREDVDESDPTRVTVRVAPRAGDHVRRRGEDVSAGDVVLGPGEVVHPADVAILCSVGRARVRVRRRPVVAILSTGDEIAEVGEPPSPAGIVNGNAWMLAAMVREAGGVPRVLGIARDSADSLAERLAEVDAADVLLTIGGVSMGDFDLVRDALVARGATLDFWKVAIRPGRPLVVGSLGATRVLGLPGNPVSSFVTFELFVRPALLAMQGHAQTARRQVEVTVAGSYAKQPGLTHYVRARLERTPHGVTAHLRPLQSSGALTSISRADALLVLPEPSAGVQSGDAATAMVLRESWDGAWGEG